MSKVALILGSLRRPGQGIGIASWLTPVLRQALNNPNSRHPSSSQMDVVFVDPTKPPLPLGAITDGTHVPADIRDPAKHPNTAVREWATFVSSCSGFVVLSPEYNGSYPGEGSSGGKRCATLLRSLLGGAFKMQLAQKEVAIKWPKGSANVPTEGEPPEWLKAFEPDVLEAIEEMKRLMAKPQP